MPAATPILIAGVLSSDSEMGPTERDFLKRAMRHVGLETDTILMATYGSDVAEEFAKLPAEIKNDTLNLVIQAAAADGKIVPAERAIVDIIAAQLGVSEEDVIERFKKALPQ